MQEVELYHCALGDFWQVEHKILIKGSFFYITVLLQWPAAVLHTALALSWLQDREERVVLFFY